MLSIQKLLIISKVFQLLKTEKPTYQPLLFVCQKHIVIMDLLGELQRAEFKEAFDEFDKVNGKNSCEIPCMYLILFASMYSSMTSVVEYQYWESSVRDTLPI